MIGVFPAHDHLPSQALPSQGRRGFTLLEMVIVLTVLALLAGLLLPLMRPRHGGDAARVAQALATFLAKTRAEAMAHHHRVILHLAADGQTLALADGQAFSLAPGLRVILSPHRPQDPTDHIVFYPNGGLSDAELRITGRGADATVRLDWLTGAVHAVP